MNDFLDAYLDSPCGIEGNIVFEVFRKPFYQLIHRALHEFGHLEGIGSRHLVDHDGGGRNSVQAAEGVVLFHAELDAGDILKADDGALLIGFHYDVSEFLLGDQAFLQGDSVRIVNTRGRRRGTKFTARSDGILLAHCIGHVVDREAEACKLVWIQPDAHGVVGAAKKGDIAYSI